MKKDTWIPPDIEQLLQWCLTEGGNPGGGCLVIWPGGMMPWLAQLRPEGDSGKSPPMRDLLVGLSVARLASLLEDKEAREKIQRIALDLVSREAKRTAPGSESKRAT